MSNVNYSDWTIHDIFIRTQVVYGHLEVFSSPRHHETSTLHTVPSGETEHNMCLKWRIQFYVDFVILIPIFRYKNK